jgi:hypothetical protein
MHHGPPAAHPPAAGVGLGLGAHAPFLLLRTARLLKALLASWCCKRLRQGWNGRFGVCGCVKAAVLILGGLWVQQVAWVCPRGLGVGGGVWVWVLVERL